MANILDMLNTNLNDPLGGGDNSAQFQPQTFATQQAPLNISDQIQQLLGAKQAAIPGITEGILSARNLPSPDDIQAISNRFQVAPSSTDYMNSVTGSLGGRYTAPQDIANSRLGNSLAQLSNLQKQQLELQQFPLKQQYLQSEIDKNNAMAESGRYQPLRDQFGSITGVLNGKTGEVTPFNAFANQGSPNGDASGNIDLSQPSTDPQIAAQQILAESGTPNVPVLSKQDVTGRNAQQLAYRNAAQGAKSALVNLNALNADLGKYTPGSTAGWFYQKQAANNIGGMSGKLGDVGTGLPFYNDAVKNSGNLALALMSQTTGAKGSGIRMAEFDSKNVPGPNLDEASQAKLIAENKAQANLQIQRGVISDLYPRMSIANVNAIMDNYEQKNPPLLPTGEVNPNFLPYTDWLKAGRPNTALQSLQGTGGQQTTSRLTNVGKAPVDFIDQNEGMPIPSEPPVNYTPPNTSSVQNVGISQQDAIAELRRRGKI